MLVTYNKRRKALVLDRALSYSEFLEKAKEGFGIENSQDVFLQKFDEDWGEQVDVDDMDQILDKDKLFLLDVCAASNMAVTISTVQVCHFLLPVFATLEYHSILKKINKSVFFAGKFE